MAIMKDKPATREEAVQALTPMVYKMAHKFARNHRARDLEDLAMDGFEGLLKAYDRFDGGKGAAFSSYAYQWIFAHIKDRAQLKWKDYNSTSGVAYEDHNLGEYSLPLDDYIDYRRMSDKMDNTTRAIHAARQQGFTYKEIAEALTQLGKPCSLHQVRNQHLKALEA